MQEISTNVRITFVLLIVFFVIVSGIVFISSVPFNPLTRAVQNQKGLFIFLPQGWAFFTKNPKEDNIYVCIRGEDGTWKDLTHPHSTFYFGAGRNMRLQGYEVSKLLSQIKLSDLQECDTLVGCNFKSVTVSNYLREPQLCGEILIYLKEPVPWAWAYHGDEVKMPIRGIICNVDCNESNNK